MTMLPKLGYKLCLAVMSCAMAATAAANFSVRYIGGSAGIFLEGDISSGDSVRLVEAAKQIAQRTPAVIDLNSSGGNFGKVEIFAHGVTSVPIYSQNSGRVEIDVTLGREKVRMMIDTGATLMLIPAEIANRLVEYREAAWNTSVTVTMADGRQIEFLTIVINDIHIGAHTLHNVRTIVAPGNAPTLLPFPILNSIGPFKINTRTHELVFDDAVVAPPVPPPPQPFAWRLAPAEADWAPITLKQTEQVLRNLQKIYKTPGR